MAATLCPTCGERVEHAADGTISVEYDVKGGKPRTRLIANREIVIHVCTHGDTEDSSCCGHAR
jgi:hypothetical protein